jgi:hypothetical protein
MKKNKNNVESMLAERLENVRSNQHQVAINLFINIIRKWSIIENLSFVFPIVSIAPMCIGYVSFISNDPVS